MFGHLLKCGQPAMATHLKKIYCPSLRSHQLPTVPQLGVDDYEFIHPLHARALPGLMLLSQLQLLWVLQYYHVQKTMFQSSSLWLLALIIFQQPLLQHFLSLRVKGDIDKPLVAGHPMDTVSLHFDQLWNSLLTIVYCKRNISAGIWELNSSTGIEVQNEKAV